jgi:hypothetical protein
VVRPQPQPLLESCECPGGLSSGEEQAAPEHVQHHRRGLDADEELLRLVEVAGADQQIDVCGRQLRRNLVHHAECLRHGIPGLGCLVARFVVTRQSAPGVTLVCAVPSGVAQQLHGLFVPPQSSILVRQHLDEAQMSRLRLVGAAQDLEASPTVRALHEELDRTVHHDLRRRELLQAVVPHRLGGVVVSPLQGEGGRGRTDSRPPRALGR